MRPLIRWTIGQVHDRGFEILEHGVRCMRGLYGGSFDYLVCHNELEDRQVRRLEAIGVELYAQTQDCCEIPFKPARINAWKLFPPRLRPESHEIFIDNDLIVTARIAELEMFLEAGDMAIGLEGGGGRAFGRFERFVKPGILFNSGFFGFPPGFPLLQRICELLAQVEPGWQHNFDEQGVVAAIVTAGRHVLIPKEKLTNSWLRYNPGPYGTHFAGANRDKWEAWSAYRRSILPMI